MLKGIDVSKFQKQIDWPKVDASGLNFALIRGGFGDDISQKDPDFDTNVRSALAAGLHVGVYWFGYATDAADAQKEAALCNQILAPYKGKLDFPIAYDYEGDSIAYFQKMKGRAPTNDEINAIARAFLDALHALGWFVNLYTNCDFIRTGKFSTATISAYDVWLADYSGPPDYPCTIQQTSSTGTIPGITGNVDLDTCTKDYPTIIKAGGYNGFPKPPQTVVGIDTTMDVTKPYGAVYTVKTTCAAGTPSMTFGTSGVVNLFHCRREGNDDYWHLVYIGATGAETGIYTAGPDETPLKRFKAIVQ